MTVSETLVMAAFLVQGVPRGGGLSIHNPDA